MPSILEAEPEAGGLSVVNLKSSLGYSVRSCLKNKIKQEGEKSGVL